MVIVATMASGILAAPGASDPQQRRLPSTCSSSRRLAKPVITQAMALVALVFVLGRTCHNDGRAWVGPARRRPGTQVSSSAPLPREPRVRLGVAATVPVLPTVTAPTRDSEFNGVSWHKRNHRWQVHVEDPKSGTLVSLGLFGGEREAAEAYDTAMMLLKGEAAVTNFAPDTYSEAAMDVARRRLKDLWRPRPSSTYHGVYTTGGSGKWKAEIDLYGVQQFLDYFESEEAAARAVDAAMRSTGVEKVIRLQHLNFKEDGDYFDDDTWEEELVPRGASSRFLGVTYHQRSGQYLAKLGRKHVGLFDSEIEAAKAFDKASLAVGGPTNFKPSEVKVS